MSFLINSYSFPKVESLLWTNEGDGEFEYTVYYYFGNEFVSNTAVIGKTITKITVNMKKSGSPTGIITGQLWADSAEPNAAYKASNETVNITSLTSSYANYTFTFTNTTAATADSKAGLHFSAKSAAPNLVYVNGVAGSVDGTHREVGDTTTWITNTPTIAMQVYGV